MSDKQQFTPGPVIQGQVPGAFNICLHYGRDGNHAEHLPPVGVFGDTKCRMAATTWGSGIPSVNVRLYPNPAPVTTWSPGGTGGIAPTHPFALTPEFPCSVISRSVASKFGLAPTSRVGRPWPPPWGQFAPIWRTHPLMASASVVARAEMSCNSHVTPNPFSSDAVSFWVSDMVPDDFAIIGRDICDKMLLLYRGDAYEGLPSGRPPTPDGRLYYGADVR